MSEQSTSTTWVTAYIGVSQWTGSVPMPDASISCIRSNNSNDVADIGRGRVLDVGSRRIHSNAEPPQVFTLQSLFGQ